MAGYIMTWNFTAEYIMAGYVTAKYTMPGYILARHIMAVYSGGVYYVRITAEYITAGYGTAGYTFRQGTLQQGGNYDGVHYSSVYYGAVFYGSVSYGILETETAIPQYLQDETSLWTVTFETSRRGQQPVSHLNCQNTSYVRKRNKNIFTHTAASQMQG